MSLYYAAVDTKQEYGYDLNDPKKSPPVLPEFETKYKVTWKKASKATRKKRVDDYAGLMILRGGAAKIKGIENSARTTTVLANKIPDDDAFFGDGMLTKIGKIAIQNVVAVAGLLHKVNEVDERVNNLQDKQQADVDKLQEQIDKLKL